MLGRVYGTASLLSGPIIEIQHNGAESVDDKGGSVGYGQGNESDDEGGQVTVGGCYFVEDGGGEEGACAAQKVKGQRVFAYIIDGRPRWRQSDQKQDEADASQVFEQAQGDAFITYGAYGGSIPESVVVKEHGGHVCSEGEDAVSPFDKPFQLVLVKPVPASDGHKENAHHAGLVIPGLWGWEIFVDDQS